MVFGVDMIHSNAEHRSEVNLDNLISLYIDNLSDPSPSTDG